MKRLLLLLALSLPLFADDLERTVVMMAKAGFATAPSFSPDGKRIAFLTNISGLPQAWIVSANGGWPDQGTALEDPVSRVLWSPNPDWLAVAVGARGGRARQGYPV